MGDDEVKPLSPTKVGSRYIAVYNQDSRNKHIYPYAIFDTETSRKVVVCVTSHTVIRFTDTLNAKGYIEAV